MTSEEIPATIETQGHSYPAPQRMLLLQTIVSSIPGVVASAMLPYALAPLDTGLGLIGFAFASMRLGAIAGGYLVAYLKRKAVSFRNVLSLGELLSAAIVGCLLLALAHENRPLLLTLLALKAATGRVVGNSRSSFLRTLGSGRQNSNVLIIIGTLIQSSYGIAGVIVIACRPDSHFAIGVLAADGLTSLIGAVLFRWLPNLSTEIATTKHTRNKPWLQAMTGLRPQFRWLLGAEIFLSAAFSGTNLLLVGMGKAHAGDTYGFMLAVYAGAFALAGYLSTASGISARIGKGLSAAALPIILGAMILLYSGASLIASLFLALFMFLAYAALLNGLDRRWFEVSEEADYPDWLAFRDMLMALIIAFGEASMSSLPDNGFAVRAGLMGATAFCFYIQYQRERKPTTQLQEHPALEAAILQTK